MTRTIHILDKNDAVINYFLGEGSKGSAIAVTLVPFIDRNCIFIKEVENSSQSC